MAGPRYSTIPGRFIEDRRRDGGHTDVLLALGRHTDNEGWCRVKQATLGKAIGATRETVCRKLKDLVEWGYVEKCDTDGSGRAIWYRVLLDAPTPPPVASEPADDDALWPDDGHLKTPETPLPVSGGSQVQKYTCDPYDHTRCDPQTITPGVTPAITHNDLLQRPSLTPSPIAPAPGRSSVGGGGGSDVFELQVLATLAADGRHAVVVEALLAPILRQRVIDRTYTPDPLAALDACRHRWRDQPRPVLEAAAELVLAGPSYRRARVKPADIDDAVRAARKAHDLAKAAAATPARAAAIEAEPVTYRTGSPEFEAYVAANPGDAERLRRVGFVKLKRPVAPPSNEAAA